MWGIGSGSSSNSISDIGQPEALPVPSTYYKFRSRVVAYDAEHGTNLLGIFFVSHAQGITKTFSIKGDKVRMDSKLFSSNIAKSTRLPLIVKSLRKWLKQNKGQELVILSDSSQEVLARIAKYHAENFTFRMTKTEEKVWFGYQGDSGQEGGQQRFASTNSIRTVRDS